MKVEGGRSAEEKQAPKDLLDAGHPDAERLGLDQRMEADLPLTIETADIGSSLRKVALSVCPMRRVV
jgi:hypothetical protein